MDTPAPVDINKLKSILGNAKKIMKAADEKFPEKKANRVTEGLSSTYAPSTPIYDERDEREPEYHTPDMSKYALHEEQNVRDYTEEDVMNSKLPPIVKEAMLKKPIPKASLSFSKFSLDGLEDLVEKPAQRPTQQPRQINESARKQDWGSGMVTISVDELNEMIDKRVNEVIAKMFVKTLTEQTVKKTVNTLINEGKLNVKKK